MPSPKTIDLRDAIKEYADDNFDEPMGDLAAGFLLDFVLEEIAPSIYNKAIRDAQEYLQARVMDLDVELGLPEFPGARR